MDPRFASGSGSKPYSSAGVGSRFVSSDALQEAQKKKEEERKAAYARTGQVPPPSEDDQPYDSRTLYERLQAQKAAKQEAFDEKYKLSNQFRGIDDEESIFLSDVQDERRREEAEKRKKELQELKEFRLAAMRKSPTPPPLIASLNAPSAASKPTTSPSTSLPTSTSAISAPLAAPSSTTSAKQPAAGKRKREGFAGVVRKKPAPATATATTTATTTAGNADTSTHAASANVVKQNGQAPGASRSKVQDEGSPLSSPAFQQDEEQRRKAEKLSAPAVLTPSSR